MLNGPKMACGAEEKIDMQRFSALEVVCQNAHHGHVL